MSVVVRVAAFVVAIGLVVGALLWRDRGDADGMPDLVDGPVVAGCAQELEALCTVAFGTQDIDWDHAAAAVHAAALEDDLPAAVVLPASWADVVDDARTRAGRDPLVRSEVLATTPLLTVGFRDRMEVLATACGVEVAALGWACIGDNAGVRWEELGGDVRWGGVVPGHLGPDTATGLLATATVVAARTGTPFSLSDLRDVGFTSWFGQVERAVVDFDPPGGSHLTAMVTRGPSSANVAVATEAELVTRGLQTAFGPLVVAVPEPRYDVELVVAGTDADRVEQVAGRLDAAALAAAGWRTAASDVPPAAPVADLPPAEAPPAGGVLTAVRSVWADVAG